MALRTLSYVGNNRWEGEVQFCNKTVGMSIQCVGGYWDIRVGDEVVSYWVDGFESISGKTYVKFSVWVSTLTPYGISPEDCGLPEDYYPTASFKLYLPYESNACGA